MRPGGDPSAIAITPDETTSSTAAASTLDTNQDPSDWSYEIGVLSGISTDNFWAFYGGEASVWNSYILGPTKPALYTIDATDGTLQPELAAEIESPRLVDGVWEVSVRLNENLNWSDGEDITAHDVAFTFDTVRELGLGGSWETSYPHDVVDIRATSDDSIVVEFGGRPTLSTWPHAVGTAPVMPSHIWKDIVAVSDAEELYGMSGAIDVGGGPLTLADAGAAVIHSTANRGYPFEPGPDHVLYSIYVDEAEAVDALATGDIDVFLSPRGLSVAHQSRVEGNPDIELVTSPANGIRYLGFNLRREPMSDPAFREALALLLDRSQLAETLLGQSEVAHSFVRPANELWFDADRASFLADLYAGDLQARLDRALRGLRASGYAWESEPSLNSAGELQAGTGLTIDGAKPAPLTILTPGDEYDPARPAYVDEIGATLGEIGFDVRPVITDFDTVVDLAFAQPDGSTAPYDMYLLGWTLGNPALPDYYRPLFSSGGPLNNTGYRSEAFDQQLEVYERAFTLEEAREALWDLEETLARDLPYLLLYSSQIVEAYRSDAVWYSTTGNIGGIQGRLGGIGDVHPAP